MAKKRGNTVTRMQVRAHKRDLRTNGGQQWMANAYYGGFGSRPQHDRDLVRQEIKALKAVGMALEFIQGRISRFRQIVERRTRKASVIVGN